MEMRVAPSTLPPSHPLVFPLVFGVAGTLVVQDDKMVLGGTFILDILALPPGIKKIKVI